MEQMIEQMMKTLLEQYQTHDWNEYTLDSLIRTCEDLDLDSSDYRAKLIDQILNHEGSTVLPQILHDHWDHENDPDFHYKITQLGMISNFQEHQVRIRKRA